MDQELLHDVFSESGVNEDVPLRNANNEVTKSKTHGGEKSSKCSQCGFSCFLAFSVKFGAFFRHISKAILGYSKTGSSSNRSKKKAAATTSTRAGVVH